MLQQNGKRFYKGLYVTFKVASDPRENTVYLSSYSSLNDGHVSILTNSMLRTYTSDIEQWLSGRVLDSRPKGRGFEPHRRHCVVVLEQDTFILA